MSAYGAGQIRARYYDPGTATIQSRYIIGACSGGSADAHCVAQAAIGALTLGTTAIPMPSGMEAGSAYLGFVANWSSQFASWIAYLYRSC